MARIIHVANFSFRAKGAFQHSVAPKLSNGMIRNGHSVLNFSDRDVARAGSLFGSRKFGRRHANKVLVRLARDTRPELMVLGHADMIEPDTLAQIRDMLPAIKIVQWNVDALFIEDNIKRISSKLPLVDATLISTSGPALQDLSRRGPGRFGFFPNPVDASIESGRNHERVDLPHDVFYVCGTGAVERTIGGKPWVMDDFLKDLGQRLPWLKPLYGGCMGQPYLTGAAYQAALESATIGLNISRHNDIPLYSSDRIAHMIGNGQVLAIERTTGYGTLFGEDELLFFSSYDELVGKLEALHTDDAQRRALAAKGYRRYYDLFNERRVARYLVDAAFGRVEPADYEWPTLI